MAVYSEKYSLLFIGNPRTGSTAIGRGLVEHCGGRYVPETTVRRRGKTISKRHSTLDLLIRFGYLDRPQNELIKFVAVRNPFDSLVSQWAKHRFRPRFWHTRTAREDLSFDEFLRSKIGEGKPQSMHARFVKGADEVIYFEQLGLGLHSILTMAGAPQFDLPLVNPTTERARHYRDYYSSELRALVERVHAEDLERFGYEF